MKSARVRKLRVAESYLVRALGLPAETSIVAAQSPPFDYAGEVHFLISHPDFSEVPQGNIVETVTPIFTESGFLNWGDE